MQHAYDNVRHYRRKLDAAGVTPQDCRRLEDLARFPFTAKADLRETYPFGMFAVPMDRVVRIHASSGTTGKPTVVGYTAKDIDTWAQLMARSIRAAGARPGDKVHVAYGYGLFTGGLEVSKDGPLDHLTVLVEGDEQALAGLKHSIKSYIGISAEVRRATIERSLGKAKRVIDKRPK